MLRNKLDDRYVLSARNQSFLVELLSGIETVKANGAEPIMRAKWENRLAEQVRAGFAGSNLTNLINQCSTTVNKVLTILLPAGPCCRRGAGSEPWCWSPAERSARRSWRRSGAGKFRP